MKHLCAKKRVWGPLCAPEAGFVPFPCQKGVVPMHGYRNVTPNPNFTIFCSQTCSGLNHTHYSKERGG